MALWDQWVARGWSGCATGFGSKLDKGGLARVARASVRPSDRKSKIAKPIVRCKGNQMPAKLFPYFQSTLCDQWKI
jgi:hypothetical protein